MSPSLAAALTDEGYREAFREQRRIPAVICCPQDDCRRPAPFQDDQLAARYECGAGHATAAMWADPEVMGTPAPVPE